MLNTLSRGWVGFFPATLEETTQHDLPSKYKPTFHYCGHEATLDLELFAKVGRVT